MIHLVIFTVAVHSSSSYKKLTSTTNTTLINVACSNTSNPRFIRDCTYQFISQGDESSDCRLTDSVVVGCYGKWQY